MPTNLLPLATALSLGFLHALEVDHLIAVTTFVAGRPALRTAALFGLRWGVGHSVAVLVLGGVLLLSGLHWPERYDALGEAAVGVMLMGLGGWALAASRKLHLHPPDEHGGHGHLHTHGRRFGTGPHPHGGEAHQHHGPHSHHHHHPVGHGVTLVGLLHGLAGTSAVVALVPVTLLPRASLGVGYLVCFGVGVTAGMMAYAMVAAYAMRQAAERSVRWGRRIAAAVGLAGIGVGAWWVGGIVR